jgi:hypothetical protein
MRMDYADKVISLLGRKKFVQLLNVLEKATEDDMFLADVFNEAADKLGLGPRFG